MTKRRLPPGVSFSPSRAAGLAQAKRKASRDLGIPLTRQSRQRQLGASLGCCVMLALPATLATTAIWQIFGG